MCTVNANRSVTMAPKLFTTSTQLQQGRKRPRSANINQAKKHVHFSSFTANEIVGLASSKEDENTIWYSKDELNVFKLTLRNHVLGREHVQETRGYERMTLERAKNKKIAIRCTLLSYKQGLKGEEVATISRKFTSWSLNEALKLGCQDYYKAYHPDLLEPTPFSDDSPATKKRGNDGANQQHRNVQARAR